MTFDDACAALRGRWSHPPLDRRDIEERVALRLREEEAQVLVLETPMPTTVAVRLFVMSPKGWRSRYVHAAADVDQVLGELLALARCA